MEMQQQQLLNRMTPLGQLDRLVPPMLEESIGYTPAFLGKLPMMRFVAFYWERSGDEVVFSDGAITATGNWHPFLLYIQHPRIRPHLSGYDFGSSETAPVHYLILDREERRLYAAPTQLAKDFLRAQQSAAAKEQPQSEKLSGPLVVDSIEDLMNQLESTTGWQEIHVSHEQVAAAMQRDHDLYTSMQEWLEQQG